MATSLQDPQPQGPPTADEQKQADRLARLVKFRADQLSRGRPDDMGGVAIPAISDPAEAMKTAQQALRGFIAANSGDHPEAQKSMQALRDYLAGKSDMPREWVLDESPMPTPQGLYAQRAAEGRERMASKPFGAEALAMQDYFVEPVGRFAAGAVQVPLDIGVGIANWAGARIKPINVRAQAVAGLRALAGEKYDPRRAEAELGGMAASASGVAQFMGKAADIGGMLRGFLIGGPVGAPTTATMKAGEVIGRTVAAPATKLVGKVAGEGAAKVASDIAGGAGAFGAYEAVTEATRQGERPTGEQALEAAKHGAVAGAAMSVAAGVARLGLRGLFGEAAKSAKVAGEDGKILDAMKEWAKKNNVVPVPHQSVAAYGTKLIDSWVAAGMPGAPPMAARRLIGRALEMGVESAGLSAIDVNFQHDFLDAITTRNPEAFARMAETYGTNFLGMAAARMRLREIPGFQRQQPTKKAQPIAQEPKPQDPEAQKRQEAADAEQQALVRERGEAQQRDLAEEFWRGYERGDPEIIAIMGDQAVGDLLRQGWQFRSQQAEMPEGAEVKLETPLPPVEARGKPSGTLELPGTGFSFEAREGLAYPSQSLRELLGLPESVPVKEFAEIINKSGIFSALDAGTLLPGEQISASPPIYAEGETMRTIAIDGTVLESPLGPEPKWEPAKDVPARGKDAIGQPQQQIVDALTHVLNARQDLSQADSALLSKIITKLDAVSWKNDPAVAETLAHIENLMVGIANGSPEHASRALQTMGEMLTTKSPDVAIDDMSREQEVRQLVQETRQRLREGREAPTEHPTEPPSETGTPPKTRSDQIREKEGGFVDIGAVADVTAEAIRRAVRSVTRMPLRAIGYAVGPLADNRISRGIALAGQEKAREQLPEPLANRFLQAETNTREYIDEWSPLVEEMPGTRIRELEAIRWQEPTSEGNEAGYDLAQIAKETALQQRFDFDPSTLPESVQGTLATWNKLTREIRRAASALKMHVHNLWTPEGELAEIAPEAKKDVLTRQSTPELVDAMRRGKGHWLYEAVTDVLANENGMSREDVERIFAEDAWTDARGLRRRDPIEHMRRFKYFPDHVRVPGRGVVRLLETQPLKHAKRMMQGAALRLGTVKELGPDDPLPTDPEVRERQKLGLPNDGLPTPYLSIVESVPENLRETAAHALRSLMGMQTNILPRDVEVGSAAHKFWRLLGGLNDTRAAGKMTFGSVLSNSLEAWGTANAMLGFKRIAAAAAEVYPRIAGGEWSDMLRERQEAGGFAIHKGEYLFGGEQGGFDQTMRAMRTSGEMLTVPLRGIQVITDMIVHKALHSAVADWREGTHGTTDADALMTLFGFSRAHAEQVVNGDAPPQAYRQIEMNGLTRITRTGDLPINKSDFARSRRGLAQAIKYTGYFQAQFAKLRKAVMNLREAETAGQQATAAANLSKLMGFNMANFVAGAALVKLAVGGWKELMGYFAETAEDVQSPEGIAKLAATSFVGSMAGSVGSAIGGGFHALFTGNDKEKSELWDTLMGSVPLLGGAVDDWNFANAAFHTLTEKPLGEDSEYSGKTPLQQIGYYVGKQLPAVKWAESGPMGLGITYLGTDPQLENALKANRRIDRKFGIEPETGRRKEDDKNEDEINDRDLFVDTMRAAVNKLKAREDDVDEAEVVQAIRDAMPDQDDRSIAASFLNRRVLKGRNWTDLSEQQQESKLRSLGAERVELLEGYDAVLDRAAAFFQPTGRKRRR